ncbi:hypothetical protein GCM10010442_39490 [Kitasatospora kifunensis]
MGAASATETIAVLNAPAIARTATAREKEFFFTALFLRLWGTRSRRHVGACRETVPEAASSRPELDAEHG